MVRETTPSFEEHSELSALLLQEELRRQGSGTSSVKAKDEAFNVKGKPWRGFWKSNERQNQASNEEGGDLSSSHDDRRGYTSCGRGGYRGNSRGIFRGGFNNSRGKGPCYYCGKDGHIESNCRIKQHAQSMRGRGRGFSNYSRKQNSNYVEEDSSNDRRQSKDEFLLMADST